VNVDIECVGTKYTSNNIIERINVALGILSKDMDDVKFIAMEGYSFSSAKSNSLFQIGEFTGALKKHFYDQGKGIMIYPPSVIKSFATGNGSAEKNLMKAFFISDYPELYPEIINTLPEFESPQSDLIDAFHIAMVLRYHIMFESKKPIPEEFLLKLSKKSSKKVSSILETTMLKKKSN
jgi:Holliday junction resolvasome RuvABC endonuclease subunit